MKTVIAEVSAKHLHLCQSDIDKLFGKNYKLTKFKNLSAKGQFSIKEKLLVIGPKKETSLRIVGPARAKSQVELAVTDCINLGVKPIIQVSGQVKKSATLWVKGPKAKIKIQCIVAWRHLHIDKIQAKAWKLRSGQKISAIVTGDRAMELKNIIVRPGPFATRLHLDTDEGNAAGIKSGAKVKLLI